MCLAFYGLKHLLMCKLRVFARLYSTPFSIKKGPLFIIRLEAMLQPNTRNTLGRVSTVLTRWTITQPKVNRFGGNLHHSDCLFGADAGRFWARSASVATAREPGEFLYSCQVSNPRFYRLPVGQISRNFERNTSIGVAMKTFGTPF